jgi:hypothetical protein
MEEAAVWSMKPGASVRMMHSPAAWQSPGERFKWNGLVAKGEPLPDAGADDRRLLFAALAQGILNYLKDNDSVSSYSHYQEFLSSTFNPLS